MTAPQDRRQPVPAREALAHLARDWDAQASQIERLPGELAGPQLGGRAESMRECARQLRFLIGIPDLIPGK